MSKVSSLFGHHDSEMLLWTRAEVPQGNKRLKQQDMFLHKLPRSKHQQPLQSWNGRPIKNKWSGWQMKTICSSRKFPYTPPAERIGNEARDLRKIPSLGGMDRYFLELAYFTLFAIEQMIISLLKDLSRKKSMQVHVKTLLWTVSQKNHSDRTYIVYMYWIKYYTCVVEAVLIVEI